MERDPKHIDKLQQRLEALTDQHLQMAEEMASLKSAIQALQASPKDVPPLPKVEAPPKTTPTIVPPPKPPVQQLMVIEEKIPAPATTKKKSSVIDDLNSNMEDFIGTNLISKIGVGAIVIGMGIGLKYAIDHDLISPLMRVLLGYLVGGILLVLSYRSRSKYEVFGAVLFSGATALLFFTTYAAYTYYALLPQGVTFGIMVALTVYVVAEALRFDQEVMAHFGLVGAYAVPYLLGEDPEGITFLFTYITIVNLGILFTAFFREWKSLYYSAFIFTWLIFASWYIFSYYEPDHYSLGLAFLSVFFSIFYMAFLAYKLIRREAFGTPDIIMILSNAFLFFGFGYLILEYHTTGQYQVGLFALINALIHLGVSAVFWFRNADRNLFFLASGLGLVFTIIAIPVQFDGNWVTLLWAGEAALLFWIGRSQRAEAYAGIATALFMMTFLSLWEDWDFSRNQAVTFTPFFNMVWLTTLWTAACFGFSTWINTLQKYRPPERTERPDRQLVEYMLPLLFLLTLYLGTQFEISYYIAQLEAPAFRSIDLSRFQVVGQVLFSLFFLIVLAVFNRQRLHNTILAGTTVALTLLFLLLYMVIALPHLYALNSIYINLEETVSISYILTRPVSYLLAGSLLWSIFRLISQPESGYNLRIPFDILLHITIIVMLSVELLCWMSALNATDSAQAGLSILWGVYALVLIIMGIRQSQRHLRITAMVLLGITLAKVTIVDLADLSTLEKTLVLVVLGALLLLISYLYNRFRERLFKTE
jgi:uncharacterized membrane protein